MAAKRAINILVGKPGSSLANKTGGWRLNKPVVDKAKCTACNICFLSCPDGCISGDKVKKYEANLDYCKGCGICAKVCPAKAITMTEEEK
jgi:pyruvate ferredoxin oxidoreductase delta subunit